MNPLKWNVTEWKNAGVAAVLTIAFFAELYIILYIFSLH